MKDIKTKPKQKRAVLPRVRRIATATAIGIIKTAKDKAVQTADTAVSVQGQENQSASTQASGQMVSGGAHLAAGTAQKIVQATAFVYRFAKKHKNIKTAQSLADIAPLEDAAPPAAADTPVQPQTDIKTRPQPEVFSKAHIPAEQPPSPEVRFVERAAPQTPPGSTPHVTPEAHVAQSRVADKAPTVSADIKTRPLPEAFSKIHIPAEQPPSPKVRFTDNGASQTRPVSAPQETPAVHIAQGRVANKTPAVPTDIKQRAAPSVKAAAKSIKTKENVAQTTAAPTQKSTPIQPNIPGGQINAASTVAPTTEIVPTAAPMQQRAGQIVKTKKCATQPVSLSTKSSPSFEAQNAVTKDKPQPAFRAPQENIKTKRDLPARFAADAPVPPQADFKSASVNASPGHGKPVQAHSIKTRGQSVTKTMRHTVNADVRGIKTAKQTAAKSKQAAKAAQKTAQQTARVVKAAAQKAAQAAKVVTKAIVSAIKAFLAALKSLVAAITAIGGTAFAIILIIALVAVIAGSVLGIFMSVEPSGHGTGGAARFDRDAGGQDTGVRRRRKAFNLRPQRTTG